MKKVRKGFTLVELLIVIVVIGILSAMMMLSSTEAVTTAKASSIVSNMRNIKTATLAYYTDNMDTYSKGTFLDAPSITNVKPYLNGENIPELTMTNSPYTITKSKTKDNSEGKWFITYDFSKSSNSTTEQTRIKAKLVGRAGSLGLTEGASATKYGGDSSGTGGVIVGMEIR